METEKECRKCGGELGSHYSVAEEDDYLILVDKKFPGLPRGMILLKKGDCLCDACVRDSVYYARVEGQ